MEINYKDLCKEQPVFLLIPAILLIIFASFTIQNTKNLLASLDDYNKQTQQVKTLAKNKDELSDRVAQQKVVDAGPELKKILEVESMNFGVDASFAPLFDNLINIARDSGIRIRSVDYNFSPAGDPIFAAKIEGYNVCELSAAIVGKYSEIQTFLKTLLSEKYLINLAQIEIISWHRDRTVLIANIKIRFYTKTK